MAKAKALSARQKKKIIADYAELGTYAAVAKKRGCSAKTVKRIVEEDPAFFEKCAAAKRQQETDVLEHFAKQGEKITLIVDAYLDALLDREKIAEATPNQLTTAMGTLLDKLQLIRQARATLDETGGGVIQIPMIVPEEKK